jgi:hypothetical protein
MIRIKVMLSTKENKPCHVPDVFASVRDELETVRRYLEKVLRVFEEGEGLCAMIGQ